MLTKKIPQRPPAGLPRPHRRRVRFTLGSVRLSSVSDGNADGSDRDPSSLSRRRPTTAAADARRRREGRQSAHTETKPNEKRVVASSRRRRRPRARSSADETVETVESHESPDASRRTLHAGTRTVVVVVVDIPIIPIVGIGIQTVTTHPTMDRSIGDGECRVVRGGRWEARRVKKE